MALEESAVPGVHVTRRRAEASPMLSCPILLDFPHGYHVDPKNNKNSVLQKEISYIFLHKYMCSYM